MSTALLASDRQEDPPEVLVASDDLFLRKLLRPQLERLGCSVREAVSLSRALARIDATRPDLVLLDPCLDHCEGFELLARLQQREETRRIPILLLGGDPRSVRTEEAVGLGVAMIPIQRAAAIAPWVEAALGVPSA